MTDEHSIYPTVEIDGVELTVHAYWFARQNNPVQPAETLYLDAELHGMRDEWDITHPETIDTVIEQLEAALGRPVEPDYSDC